MTWKKRIISIALCLCALLCAASVRAEAADHTDHPICGTTCNHTGENHSTGVSWQAWDGKSEITYTNNVAYIYLSQDVTLPDFLTIANGKTLYLCLNGHNLKMSRNRVIDIDGGTFILCNCKDTGAITQADNNSKGMGVGLSNNGTFTMYGGSITGNKVGVNVGSGCIFTMYGGSITANEAGTDWGGGVRNDGTFTMYDGVISNNSADIGGGVYNKGKFTMSNGTIINNTAAESDGGGGVYNQGTFTMSDGEISGNTTTFGGGVRNYGTFTMSGGMITGNTAANNGGGVNNYNGTFNISGNVTITGNKKGSVANNVYLPAGSTITLAGALGTNASIGVTTSKTPGSIPITGGVVVANKSWASTSNFIYDNNNNNNTSIAKKTYEDNGTDKVQLVVCKHNYNNVKWTPNTDASTGHWRKCNNCDTTQTAAHSYSSDWKTDNSKHWHECECGQKSEEAEHSYSTAWKTGDGKHWHECVCGQKSGEAEHSYSTAWKTGDGKHWHECECGQKSGEANHSYSSDWKTGDGKHWHECVCGQKSEEAEHSYSTAWQRDDTSHFHECSACGDKKDITTCVYNQENVDDNYRMSAATCTAKAVYYKSCVCARAGTETFEYGEKLAHTYDKEVATETYLKSAATCTDKAVYYKSCVCGARGTDTFEYGEKLAHTYDKEVATETYLKSAATCTAKAVYYKSCVCGATGTATFEYGEKNPNNHTGQLGDWQTNTDEHWKVYSCCQAQSDKAAHTWNEGTVTTPATCTTPGEKTYTCGTCSATKKVTIPASGHDLVHHEAKAATCTAVGWDAYDTCRRCDYTTYVEKPASGHDLVHHEAKAATCTAVGWDAYDTCTRCDYTTYVEKSASGHDLVHHEAKAATCMAVGWDAYDTCTRCDYTTYVEKAALGHDFTVPKYDEIQHWYKCANCTATTEPVAHTDFTAWKSDRSGHWHECSTCGYKTAVNAHTPDRDKATETTPQLCTECGYVIAPATHPVHTWVFVAETPATCNAAGEREHYECTCGRTSFKNGDAYDINEDASVLTIEKNSANHTGNIGEQWLSDSENHWQEYTCCHARANEAAHSGGAATCTAQAVCEVCGKAYGPLAAHAWQPATCTAPKTCSVCHTTEGTALGHAWQPATCTEPKTCSVCDATEGAALGHAWQPATCTAPKTCSVCHTTEGAALGHDWGAWKVTTPATKDAPGVETRTCAHNSAHTETRSIPKLSTTVYTVSEDTKIAQIEAKVDGLDKILELDENKALVNDGKSVGVSLTVKNTASSGVSEKIKEKLAGSNLVGLRLELTVEKTVTENGAVVERETIPDTVELLKTTITLPAELQGKSGYVVYRLHDGNVHVLTEKPNENGEFITVSADKTQITICARLYSEYVIAYQTSGSSGGGYHPVNPTPVKATSANTGDAGVLLYGVTAALSLTGTAWLGAKSRKH